MPCASSPAKKLICVFIRTIDVVPSRSAKMVKSPPVQSPASKTVSPARMSIKAKHKLQDLFKAQGIEKPDVVKLTSAKGFKPKRNDSGTKVQISGGNRQLKPVPIVNGKSENGKNNGRIDGKPKQSEFILLLDHC